MKKSDLPGLKHLFILFFLCASVGTVAAQQPGEKQIRGTVSDEDGIPLAGVNILVKGTAHGTQTDFDGNYSIEVPSQGAVLTFSYIGFKTEEIAIKEQSSINITLSASEQSLDEVVVIGYGRQKRETVTGAVSQVESEEISKAPVANVSEALVGKLAGVSARQSDGRPGNTTSFQIRNFGTPLYVIDGVPQGADQYNNLNPGDIESVSVLKDAAASIYGVRASNGVVLVTTKSGKYNQKSTIKINSYYGWQSLTRFYKPALAGDYVRAMAEADINQNGTSNWTREEVAKWQEGTEPGYQGFDWSSYIRKGVPQRFIQGSVTGGSEKIHYYFSASNINQEAVFEGYNFNRTNLQSNISANIGKRIKAGIRINGKIEKNRTPGVPGTDDYMQALRSQTKNRPTETPYANNNPEYLNTTSSLPTNNAMFAVAGYARDIQRTVQTNFDLEYDVPVEGLKLKGIYSYFYNNLLYDVFEKSYDTYTYNRETDTYVKTGGRSNRYRSKENRHIQKNIFRAMADYNRTFNGHHIAGILGVEAEEIETKNFFVRSIPSTNVIELINDVSEVQETTNSLDEQARQGYFFRVNYDYENKYLLEVAGRYDAAWKFAPGKRWGFFPSVSAGWRMSEEPFMKNTGVLSDLKIRASYGEMGDDNIGIGPYAYLPGYNYGAGNAVLDGEVITGIAPRGMPISTLSWIRSRITNVGIDFSMFDNKLDGSLEGFYRKRTGLPGSRNDVILPVEVNIDLPPENLGADANIGMEFSLNYRNSIGKVSYTIGGNATLSRKRNLYTYNPQFGSSWDHYRNSSEDRWAGVQWGKHVIGRFKSEEEISGYPVNIDGQNNTTLMPGDFIYEDVNGDGVINGMDDRPTGYGEGQQPYLMYGLNGGLKYKNFDFSFTFAGGSMQSRGRGSVAKVALLNNQNSPDYLLNDRWHREDIFDPDSPWVSGTYPALRRTNREAIDMGSDFWFLNITYLRLRNVQLGYNLPESILSLLNIEQLRFYINGFNLFSVDNMKGTGMDPEIMDPGGHDYPPNRVVNAGFNLTF
ncbi:SusC/RagA family TonB-linked outer membrane protein [Sinomicrobium soli]|uniref:SusC/RagA family TonB-linked outer membrane protein n=1 Tax=Sinomicrobium sp. N-1-3-6 TaxID=2219864 RepID=UPI001375093B|nr:TonB-dependent receptor [Sinomicrobium sp. N-1-3-6]